MKNINDVNLENLVGKTLKCIELINNNNDLSSDIFLLDEKEDQKKVCDELNYNNKSKNFKYICINYQVQNDLSLMSL